MENVAGEDGIFELETPSSEILEEMTYDRSEMMNCVDQQVCIIIVPDRGGKYSGPRVPENF
jgi:hypothetical protein